MRPVAQPPDVQSFRNFFTVKLVNSGLWYREAEAVMEQIEDVKGAESMKGRWNDRVADYPPVMSSVLWLHVRHAAIDYLKATKPQHFALAVLEKTLKQHETLDSTN